MSAANGFAVLPSVVARDPTIEPILKALLLALSSFAGADQSCYPSNKTLCDCTGLSERAVREWLGVGAQRGLLTVHRRTQDNGAPASNLYSLNFSKWGDSLTRQTVPGVPADSAGWVGRHGAPGGAQPCPRWGATVPPNNTSDQDQENITKEQDTPLPSVAAPTGATALSKERKERAPRTTFSEPTEADTLEIIRSLVPTLPQFRQERIATACFSYWQSAGWKRKSGPIKDWPATVRTWVTNQADRDKDVSVALASKPAKPAAPAAAKVYPYYAKSGKGLDAPEYYDPEYGWTDMTEARWKETGDALPF